MQTIFPLCTPPFRLPVLPPLWEPGLPLAHIHWSCISISADIPIWPSVLDKCWDSISTRTLIILTSPPASLNSGAAGIFLLEAGSVITSTSHWGGNRVSTGRHIRNILVVWALTGLWHGASWNFVFWGVYYGLLLLAEKFLLGRFLEKAPVWLRNLYTMFAVIIGWVFFSQTTPAAIGKNAGSHVWIWSFLLRRPCLPVCTEIRTDPDDHFRDQLPSGALPVFQAPCKTQYLPLPQ